MPPPLDCWRHHSVERRGLGRGIAPPCPRSHVPGTVDQQASGVSLPAARRRRPSPCSRKNLERRQPSALEEDHLEEEGRDCGECEHYQDIYNPDRDPIATLPALLAPPELVELVGLGHVPSLALICVGSRQYVPRFVSACQAAFSFPREHSAPPS
jgi:hypothetical protein